MDESFPGRVHFVAHAIREIRNRLPDAIAGVEKQGPRCHDLATKVRSKWESEGFPSDGSLMTQTRLEPSSAGPDRYEVSAELLEVVGSLVAGNARASGNKRRQSKRLLTAIWGDSVPSYVVSNWVQGTKWVDKYMHLGNRQSDSDADTQLADRFGVFEEALFAISNRSYENLEVLDDILDTANR